ncbi:hypothetical protein E2C01_072458 [Portunus trituberculatus]|uniref:Uncharacterized protein n=1 Tax=Portunus trituberculatus TaxID=210409 RepID=A0A5B7IAS8_PORTR|nr:hypothetical protein [Portunus trituberculatus]
MRGRRNRKEAADRMLALGRERGGKEGNSEHDIEEFYYSDGGRQRTTPLPDTQEAAITGPQAVNKIPHDFSLKHPITSTASRLFLRLSCNNSEVTLALHQPLRRDS